MSMSNYLTFVFVLSNHVTLCLRFVFYAVVDFFQVCLGTKLLRIEGESQLTN